MERVREPLYIGATCAATSAHLRPIDAVLIALEETPCAWCQGLLRLIKAHLEADIPAGWEVRN